MKKKHVKKVEMYLALKAFDMFTEVNLAGVQTLLEPRW